MFKIKANFQDILIATCDPMTKCGSIICELKLHASFQGCVVPLQLFDSVSLLMLSLASLVFAFPTKSRHSEEPYLTTSMRKGL